MVCFGEKPYPKYLYLYITFFKKNWGKRRGDSKGAGIHAGSIKVVAQLRNTLEVSTPRISSLISIEGFRSGGGIFVGFTKVWR